MVKDSGDGGRKLSKHFKPHAQMTVEQYDDLGDAPDEYVCAVANLLALTNHS